MSEGVGSERHSEKVLQARLASALEWLITAKSADAEIVRQGRLFNTLMLISLVIVTSLTGIFLAMQPLGYMSPRVSWIAAAFPMVFFPIAVFCITLSRRGLVQPMAQLYVWVNLAGISIAVWLFDGVYSPGWILYIWNITIAGILLAPAYALWLTAGVLGYFLILLLLTYSGLYTPLLSFGGGREFADISLILTILVTTVGLLTYLNMRSLQDALGRMRASEERFRSVFDNAADLIFTVAKDTRYTSLNPAFEKILGWPKDEWLGKSFVPLVPEADLATTYNVLQRTLQGEAVEPFEIHVRKKSGETIVGEFTVAPLRQGSEVTLLGICRDVTERSRMDESLRASEQRFHTIFDTAQDGIFTTSADGLFTSVNPAMERLLGWKPAELKGHPFTEWVHPDDLSAANKVFWQVANGKPGEIEVRIRTKAGIYKTLHITGGPMTENGVVAGTLCFCRDITERLWAEQRMLESEALYRTISSSAHDAILMMDNDGNISYWNPAAENIFGYTAAEVMGKELHMILAPERFLNGYRKGFSHFRTSGEGPAIGKTLELAAVRKNGEEFPIEVSLSAVMLGGKWNAVGILRDISVRKKTEEEIKQLNESLENKVQERTHQLQEAQEVLVRKEKLAALGQVASSVGHELRNPLGVMNNAVYFLQTVLTDADETTREYLGIIKNEIAEADHIVGDLLDSVRTKTPQTAAVSVGDLIEQALGKCIIPASVNVRQDIPASLPPLKVDPLQLQQVFRNLISNGVEAMPEGGTLEIRAGEGKTSGMMTIEVHDSGVGMTAEHLGKLFQPLFTTKAGGTGLGLMVVKNLTQANGGSVEVQSEPGKGTTFSITLPKWMGNDSM